VPVDAQKNWRRNAVDAGMAVEDGVILVGEIVERRGDRERDHDRVDPLGPHRERANDRADNHREDQSRRNREPPRPAHSSGDAVDAENRDDIAGETGDRHLREAHCAAIARQEHQAQRDRAEHVRPAEDLGEDEAAGDRRHNQDDSSDEDRDRIDVLQPHGLRGRARRNSRAALCKRHGQRPASRPCGRTASTSTMIRKVRTIA
jgi:hypothetical protein